MGITEWPSHLSGGSQITKRPVYNSPDQRNRGQTVSFTCRLGHRATTADDHLEQDGRIVLPRESILRQVFNQRPEHTAESKSGAQQLFDQHLRGIDVVIQAAHSFLRF
jgi:hypothetical protein